MQSIFVLHLFALVVFVQLTLSQEDNTRVPQFISKDENITAQANSTVRLECDVKNLGEHVVLWKFKSAKTSKTQILYANNFSIQASAYPQISLNSKFNSTSKGITINHLNANLEGSYICEISTRDANRLFYNVSIMTSPI